MSKDGTIDSTGISTERPAFMYFAFNTNGIMSVVRNTAKKTKATVKGGRIKLLSVVIIVTSAATIAFGDSASKS